MALKTIAEEWDNFAAHVFLNWNPSSAQVEDMRRSFYAGALVMHGMLGDASDPSLGLEAGNDYLHERRNEAEKFFSTCIQKDVERN